MMIISENIKKVKRKVLNLINISSSRLSIPEKKFVFDVILGMVLRGGKNVSEIGHTLKEPIWKRTNQHLKLIYYNLLKGIQKLFEGVKELFRFRWRRKRKNYIENEVKKQRLLFPEMHPDFKWIEFAR